MANNQFGKIAKKKKAIQTCRQQKNPAQNTCQWPSTTSQNPQWDGWLGLRHKTEDSNNTFHCQPTTNRTMSDSISQIHKNEWMQCGSGIGIGIGIPKSSDGAGRRHWKWKIKFVKLTLKWWKLGGWRSGRGRGRGSLRSLEDDGDH